MLFMVIESYEGQDMVPTYQRLRDAGRGVPDSVRFHGSWVEASFGRCFQVMECDDLADLQRWMLHWRGTGVTFEVIPVAPGADVAKLVEPLLAVPPVPGT